MEVTPNRFKAAAATMRSGPHGNAGTVDDHRHVMGMDAAISKEKILPLPGCVAKPSAN